MRDREAVDPKKIPKEVVGDFRKKAKKKKKKKNFNSSASILSQYSRLSEKRIAKFREKRIFEKKFTTFEL
jgi:hypothetical protein